MTFSKRNKRALLGFLGFYVIFGLLLYVFQERIIYVPGSQDFVDCQAQTSAERVRWGDTRMYVKQSEIGMVIIYHGNAGSACDRDYYARAAEAAGLGYIIPEYTGYSNDHKKPSHEAIRKNVDDVIEYLNNKKHENVIVIGESIGTGVASLHASKKTPSSLLLISPFYDLEDVARGRFWFYPTKLLTKNVYTNGEWLRELDIPITIVHGTNDTIVPFSSGERLFESLTTPEKAFVSIPSAGHNDIFLFEESYDALNKFLMDATTRF